MGGWIQLCTLTTTEMPYRAQEFEKRYKGFLERAPEDPSKHLIGIVEQNHIAQGYPVVKPVLMQAENSKNKEIISS